MTDSRSYHGEVANVSEFAHNGRYCSCLREIPLQIFEDLDLSQLILSEFCGLYVTV